MSNTNRIRSELAQISTLNEIWKANFCFQPGISKVLNQDDLAVIKTFCRNNQLIWTFPETTKNMSNEQKRKYYFDKITELLLLEQT